MEVASEPKEVASGASTQVAASMREADDMSLKEMIDSFGAEKNYQLKIIRTQPKKWCNPGGQPFVIEGHLGTYEEWQTEEEIKAMFGGGSFQMQVFRPNAKGSMTYFKSATVKVSGKPKGEGIEEPVTAVIDYGPPAEDTGAVSQAMNMAHQMVEDLRNSNNSSGTDMAMLATMMEPMKAQMAAAQAQLMAAQTLAAEKDARILELIGQKPDTSENDKLVHKMFDTEASRANTLRDMHASEMRTSRENARDDAKRSEDRHHEELRAREDAQRREIDNLNRSNDQLIATLKMSYEARIDSLKADTTRTERDLTDSRTELVTLRAKKDKTIIEQASEFAQIKESIETITGGGKGDDDRSRFEKAIDYVVENPESIARAIGTVTGGNPTQQQQQPAPQQPQPQPQIEEQAQSQAPAQEGQQYASVEEIPIGTPFRGDDGQFYMKSADGSLETLTYEQALALVQDEEAKQNGGLEKPSPMEVKAAIGFMESAFTAGTDAATFTASAKSMIPGSILKYIEAVGIDKFLKEVAVLEQGSPLRNQAGRTFIRDVAKFLLEGVPG